MKKRSVVLLLTYIFYEKKINSTTVDLIFYVKRSVVLLLTYIFYEKKINSTTVDLIFYAKKVNKVL